MQNENEIINTDEQLILKTQTDEDGEEFTIQINSVINSSFINL
jgi:hypothetical protein